MPSSLSEKFARLREIGRNSAPKSGRIIIIPKDVFRIKCENIGFHGKMHTTICFRAGTFDAEGKVSRKAVDEEQCSCGIIYKQEK